MVVDANSARMLSGDRVTDNYVRVEDTKAVMGGQYSSLTIEGSTSLLTPNVVSLVSDNDLVSTNARAVLSMSPTSASVLVNTNANVAHGLIIGQTQTTLSGGTNSTGFTLDNGGATFENTVTGGPATVTGVADGYAPFDAVNRRQLDGLETSLSSGIASIAALAAIPGPVGCKNYSAGLGFGNYNGQSAVAVGMKANLPKSNVSLAAGAGFSNHSSSTVNAGVSFSF